MIYFIRAGVDGPVKIGWSTDIPGRMSALQTGQPFKVNLLRVLDAPRWAEQWLHRNFDGLRLEGEWFSFSEEMLLIEPPKERPERRRTRTADRWCQVWVTEAWFGPLDDWRRTQQDIPPRAEAARRLIVRGLEADKPPSKPQPTR